jgi:hypothetical protein
MKISVFGFALKAAAPQVVPVKIFIKIERK